MKRKAMIVAALLGMALCACSEENGTLPSETELSEPVPAQSLSAAAVPTTASQTTALDSVTYLWAEDFVIPVSRVRDGEQLLTGDLGAYSLLPPELLKDAPDARELSQTQAPEESGLGPLACSGNWDLFPEPAEYKTYSPTEQPWQPDWTAYFEGVLKEMELDCPVILRQSVCFLRGGVETTVVLASNAAASTEDGFADAEACRNAVEPANKHPGIYTLCAVFVPGEEPVTLYSRSCAIEPSMGAGYVSWEGEESYVLSAYAMQYDAGGTAAAYPIFTNMTGQLNIRDYCGLPRCLVADIDADHASELVVSCMAASSVMSWCKVYELEREGPVQTMHMVLN